MFLLALLLAAATADKPGTHDYPLLQRFPNQFISSVTEKEWDTFDFEVAHKPRETVRGRLFHVAYDLQKGAEKPSALEWSRNYHNALASAGWTIDTERPDFLVAHLARDGREIWAALSYKAGWGTSHFDVIEKAPMPVLIEPGKPTPVPAGPRPEPAKDYPAISRLPGQVMRSYDEKKFDAYSFEMAGHGHRVEGRKLRFVYDMAKDQKVPSAIHFAETYRQLFRAEGWTVLTARPSLVSALLDDSGKQTWAQVEYNPGWGSMSINVVEPAEFHQQVSASSLVDQLKREGHVAFQVHFDTGEAAIRAESQPAIAQMVEMLKSDPALKVEVQGHTDNTGDEKGNLALSEARAKSVLAALVQGGIDAARLTAKGYGRTRPVADNDTEGGRALNRRVELQRR